MAKRKQAFHTDEPLTVGLTQDSDTPTQPGDESQPDTQHPHLGPTTPAAARHSPPSQSAGSRVPSQEPMSQDSVATQKRYKPTNEGHSDDSSRSHSGSPTQDTSLQNQVPQPPGPPRKYGSSLGDLVAAATLAESVPAGELPSKHHNASARNSRTTSPDRHPAPATEANHPAPITVEPTTSNGVHLAPPTNASTAGAPAATSTNSGPGANGNNNVPTGRSGRAIGTPRDIVEQFSYMLDKSQQLFAGLKEFTPLGTRPWQDYFKKTFEVYTRIWRFQQEHRAVLENPEHYGLKRYVIGEIASKIGQLYYHYYIRTSETNYLLESYTFYFAIRDRAYFRDIPETKNSALFIKKIRFYARFIVACVLLSDDDMAWRLLEESQALLDHYFRTCKPVDSKEWQLVMQEISTFLEAERRVIPRGLGSQQRLPVARRTCEHAIPSVDSAGRFHLQEVVVVGGYPTQFKFSELTVDMYRMIMSLEYEPALSNANLAVQARLGATLSQPSATKEKNNGAPTLMPSQSIVITGTQPSDMFAGSQSSATNAAQSGSRGTAAALRQTNPHKNLLFRPTYSNLMQNITQAFKETPDHAAFLVYLSAPGLRVTKHDQAVENGFVGGVATRSSGTKLHHHPSSQTAASTGPTNPPPGASVSSSSASATAAAMPSAVGAKSGEASEANTTTAQVANCLHPADLVPFTRKAMFLVVESTNSIAYKSLPRLFNQPFLCLMSPVEYHQNDSAQLGHLFTLFLHSPALGLLALCGIAELESTTWQNVQAAANDAILTISPCMTELISDKGLKRFLQDTLLHQLMARYVFCHVAMSHHSKHAADPAKYLPSSHPELPNDLLMAPKVVSKVKKVVAALQAEAQFPVLFPPPSPTAEKETVQIGGTDGVGAEATGNEPNQDSLMDADAPDVKLEMPLSSPNEHAMDVETKLSASS
ncbi:hypothetical protein IWQ60_003753 [Tieghemiomyces parasiticus]|uniref:Protein SCAI n=1 Tax=Tieghemiomyces parasiticus TaxID=78921 RepID=A0A9W8E0E2_9FUNG|nr:hypothetical protein IWQ60_003753 [Tieghemiomyces parasiticus]